jgi:hypothetical protein
MNKEGNHRKTPCSADFTNRNHNLFANENRKEKGKGRKRKDAFPLTNNVSEHLQDMEGGNGGGWE